MKSYKTVQCKADLSSGASDAYSEIGSVESPTMFG